MSSQVPLGSWARRGPDGRQVAEPRDERELTEVLNVLVDRAAALHRDIALSRARFTDIEPVARLSMTVEVGAGVVLSALEAHLKVHSLTLGPLSPQAMKLSVADFLEGPYSGLRSISGGRLEPICTSVRVLMSDGKAFQTPAAPRNAAGPDLNALVLGGQGRLALATRAVLKCAPIAAREAHACFGFSSAKNLVAALQRVLAEGFLPWQVLLVPQPSHIAASVHWAGSLGGVERDAELLTRCATEAGATPQSAPQFELPPSSLERECTWDAVREALENGRPLQLFRLSLSTVVVQGIVEGLALQAEAHWHVLGEQLLPLDARRAFGGAP